MGKNRPMERRLEFQARAESAGGQDAPELWVEGHALRFESPTVLFEIDGVEYREQIARGALDGAMMDDVIFNYNHSGRVMARTRNHTLQLSIDEQGLKVRARLDGTEEGRRMYEEIQKGYIDRMSFQFTIAQEAFSRDERMWTVEKIKRLYDVSAVDIPAYDDTSIEARKAALLDADAQEGRRAAETALARRRLGIKIKLL